MAKQVFIIVLGALLAAGCFMETAVPLSPVDTATYPEDLVDNWVMVHDKSGVAVIERKDAHQLTVTFRGSDSGPRDSLVYHVHISRLDGEIFINARFEGADRYELYKLSRPCPDVILLYLPNPELIDKDIETGRVKGRIVQDFFTHRVIEEDRDGLIDYIKRYRGRLFVPFRYMVRASKAGRMPEECRLEKYPGVPVSDKPRL